ncbi:MAG: cation:proton antiporter [Nitrospinota bacterium]
MEMTLLTDIVIIFGLSMVILIICHRLRIPPIVGFLLSGVLAGPYGLGLIKGIHEVELLAEIGVVLLLFTIGIEFSLKRLLQIRRSVLIGGSLQVILTILATLVLVKNLGQPVGSAIFIGFLIALSSTAIVLRQLQESAQVDSPHGRTILGILIFQDIIIVPMILITPILTGQTVNVAGAILILLTKGILIIGLVIVSAKWIVPYVLYQVAKTRRQELFSLTVALICLSIAWITSRAGLSLALGAFMAGLIISESKYSHQALGSILPFRDIFTSFFFVSIGMLLNVGLLIHQPGRVLLIALGIIVLKALIASLATIILGFPLRTSIMVGLALGQVGEFSFILSKEGLQHGLISNNIYQLFLAFSIITMAATPFIIRLASPFSEMILRLPLPDKLTAGLFPVPHKKTREEKKEHLIIIGFGVAGRNVARAAKFAGIPYAIIETNPELIWDKELQGENIYYGDATHWAVLKQANVSEARIVVIVINDPTATRRITEQTRRLNPKVHLIVRTHYLQEMGSLYDLGADEVIPEEFETSVEIFTRVLEKYLVPRNDIEQLVSEIRAGGYDMFRSLSRRETSLYDLKGQLSDVEINTLKVVEGSRLVGKTLAESNIRKEFGVNILAVRRGGEIISNPEPETEFVTGDVLILLGKPGDIVRLMEYIDK